MTVSYDDLFARTTDLARRMIGIYPVGPILPSGEPEFGYRVFPTLPNGSERPPIYGEAHKMILELLVEAQVGRHHIKRLLAHIDDNTCLHEETYRGGTIWTICSNCGRKWADDDGGFQPNTDPLPVANAREFLS